MRLGTETTGSHRLAHPWGSPNTILRCHVRQVTRWQRCVPTDMGTDAPGVLWAELVSEGAGAAERQEGLL